MSLNRVMLQRVLPLTLVVLTGILLITRYSANRIIKGQIGNRVAQSAKQSANGLDDRIEWLRESARSLAENDLLINSIIDKSQRDLQLQIFFRSLRLPSPAFRQVVMSDYRGRQIASTDGATSRKAERYLPLTSNGDEYFEIGAERILIVVPVLYSNSAEASVAVEYDTDSFFRNIQPLDDGQRLLVKFEGSDVWNSSATDDSSGWISSTRQLQSNPAIQIERSEAIELAMASANALDMFLVGTLVASCFAVFLAISKASNIATRPLSQLIQQVNAIEDANDLTTTVNVRGTSEFQSLAGSFNRMIQSLSTTTVSLDSLRASEQRLRTVVEGMPNGVVGTDRDGEIVLINAALEEIFGFPREELLGQKIETLIAVETLLQHVQDRSDFFESSDASDIADRRSLYGIHKDGSNVPVEIGLTPVRWANGEGVLASVVDISSRRQQELENERLRHETQLILDSLPSLVIYKDLENHLIRVNAAASEMIGASRQEIEGRHSSEFFREHEKYYQDDLEVIRSDKPRLGIVESITTDSSGVRWVSTDKIPIRDSRGEPIGIIVVANDITDLKAAQEKLANANEDLKRSNDELEQFAYVASHDLQEPLRKINSFSTLLVDDCSEELSDDAKRFLNIIVDGSQRMRVLIQDLLAFSRIDFQDRQFVEIDAHDAARTAIDNLSEAIKDSNASVSVDELPVVRGDNAQMVLLFQNLIANGIKYNQSQEPEIRVYSRTSNDEWMISISDNGIGIDPKYHDRIFGVFKRLHRLEEYPGTGIGLAICRRIAERLGGSIRVDSKPGVGSTFHVSIPRDVEQ
ncbi:MAG: PAS domain S-box protein [Planctomycetota bacterium]